jgi:hypothetical protein
MSMAQVVALSPDFQVKEGRTMAREQSNGLPILYTPEEVGKRLGCSGWWVREQCRRDRFPHTRAAGAIRFTCEQFGEILRILERRPESPQQQGGQGTGHSRRFAGPEAISCSASGSSSAPNPVW